MWEASLEKRMSFEPERRVAVNAVRVLSERYPNASIDVEYPISPWSQLGIGDVRLVLTDRVIVLETKYLDLCTSGKTARAKRTKHRKLVIEQCRTYCAWAKLQHDSKSVLGYVATNEHVTPCQVVSDMSRTEAIEHVVKALRNCKQPHVWEGVVERLVTSRSPEARFVAPVLPEEEKALIARAGKKKIEP